MNPISPSIAHPVHSDADRRVDAIGAAVTVLLHAVVIALMLWTTVESSRRARSASAAPAMQVDLVTESAVNVPETPAEPIEMPQDRPPLDTLPQPQTQDKPTAKPKPSKSSAKSTAASAATATPNADTSNDSEELEDVVGRIRDNWLEPPGISKTFRCRLRLDYAIGGRITAVHFLQGCGALALDDSVKRAIWKTQTLSLQSAAREAGSIEIDFTP